jgi:hypothetical protein
VLLQHAARASGGGLEALGLGHAGEKALAHRS